MPSAQMRVQKPAPSQRAPWHAEALPQAWSRSDDPVVRTQNSSMLASSSTSGLQPKPGGQPPSAPQTCEQYAGNGVGSSKSTQSPLRHAFGGPKHAVPSASSPMMSAGGSQMGAVEPRATWHWYAGNPVKRAGQSAAERQVALQPNPGMHKPVPHSVPPAVHGFSISTHIGAGEPPATVQACPAGQSRALSQGRVHCPEPPVGPKHSPSAQLAGDETAHTSPVSSGTQRLDAHTCSSAHSP